MQLNGINGAADHGRLRRLSVLRRLVFIYHQLKLGPGRLLRHF
jgi:hypothetical protein